MAAAFRNARACTCLVIGVAVPAFLGACMGKDPYNPGTALGTYHVTGTLKTNTCGGAGTAPDPWSFDVKLSKDHSTLYWIQGDVPVQGTLDANLHTSMTSEGTTTIHDADAGLAKCAITRDDALDTTLKIDPNDANGILGFNGTLGYTFSATSDSDCSDQLTAVGGGFDALPCSVSYAILGVRTKAP